MFDSFLIPADSLKNDYENGNAVGFQFQVRIADYRGCFLSLHNGYFIECDGIEYKRDVQTFEVNGKSPRNFEEIKAGIWEHWDYGVAAVVHVKKEGGLCPGKHVIRLQQSVFNQYGYAPWDEELVKNPPVPGNGIGSGKTSSIFSYELELQEEVKE